MKSRTRSIPRFTLLATAAFVAALLASGHVSAHHSPGHGGGGGGGGGEDPTPTPPPPPPDSGWLYYWVNPNENTTIYRQASDASTNQLVSGAPTDYGCTAPECTPGAGSTGKPSHATHDGDRWYLASAIPSADVVFPNVAGYGLAQEIDVVREGDAAGLRLSDNRAGCLHMEGFLAGGINLRWAPDASGDRDGAVSFAATRWADQDGDPAGDCETFVEAGIFRAALTTDVDGAFSGMASPSLVVPVPTDSNLRPILDAFTWSPDGSFVAYAVDNDGLWLASVGAPASSHTQIVSDTVWEVDWSPDLDSATPGLQTRLLFTRNRQVRVKGQLRAQWLIETSDPDGTNRVEIVESAVSKNGPDHRINAARWSPGGTQIGYIEGIGQTPPSELEVHRVDADGSGNTLLHSQSGDQVYLRPLLGWTDVD